MFNNLLKQLTEVAESTILNNGCFTGYKWTARWSGTLGICERVLSVGASALCGVGVHHPPGTPICSPTRKLPLASLFQSFSEFLGSTRWTWLVINHSVPSAGGRRVREWEFQPSSHLLGLSCVTSPSSEIPQAHQGSPCQHKLSCGWKGSIRNNKRGSHHWGNSKFLKSVRGGKVKTDFCSILLRNGNIKYIFRGRWKWKSLSRVRLLVTPWTTQSMESSGPEYWSG